MNNFMFTGNTVAPAEVTHRPSANGGDETIYGNLRIAVRREFTPKNSDAPKADFIRLTLFGRQATWAEQYCAEKGQSIEVQGHVQTGSYEKDGQTVYTTDFIVDKIGFCGKKSSDAPAQVQAQAVAPQPVQQVAPQPVQAQAYTQMPFGVE